MRTRAPCFTSAFASNAEWKGRVVETATCIESNSRSPGVERPSLPCDEGRPHRVSHPCHHSRSNTLSGRVAWHGTAEPSGARVGWAGKCRCDELGGGRVRKAGGDAEVSGFIKQIRLRGTRSISLLAVCLLLAGLATLDAVAEQRPPAVPLVAHDPYFSIWSMNDKLTDGPTRHWTGKPQPLTGLVRVDGKSFRYMGDFPEESPSLQQSRVEVAGKHTIYRFTGPHSALTLTFFTPAFPQDLDLLSRPVTYLSWKVASEDGKPHDVSLLLDASPLLAVNEDNEAATWGRLRTASLDELHLGSRDQRVLNRS